MALDPTPLLNVPTDFNLITFVREGGSYCAVLELLAIGFLLRDRGRLLATLKEKDAEIREISKTCFTVMSELKTFLFSERKA
jgi:hypothetical protein